MATYKADILSVMHAIAEDELDKEAPTLQQATYNDQKLLISELFNSNKGYNTGIIMLRLVVIDSLYSTNAAYSYFSFEEMADKIYNLLGKTEEGARQYFYEIACRKRGDEKNLFQEPFGIQKNLSEGNKQMSLLSKYAYYTLYSNKECREKYPLGFPIYDSLAMESYPTVCKMLGIPQLTEIWDNIERYVQALDEVRKVLFEDEQLFKSKNSYQQFDILDAYLWRMGKFNGGNLSLLLGRDDYIKFVKNLKMNALPVEGEDSKFREEYRAYKERINGKADDFDFNQKIVELYANESCKPFEGLGNKKYLNQLLSHWRRFNQAKTIPARYVRYQKNHERQPVPIKQTTANSTNGQKTIGQLAADFKTQFGSVLRIYNGRSKADDSLSLQEVGLTGNLSLPFDGNQKVGDFIAQMEKIGLKVKVYTCDEWVAVLDGLTLESSGKVKKNAVKADMEKML